MNTKKIHAEDAKVIRELTDYTQTPEPAGMLKRYLVELLARPMDVPFKDHSTRHDYYYAIRRARLAILDQEFKEFIFDNYDNPHLSDSDTDEQRAAHNTELLKRYAAYLAEYKRVRWDNIHAPHAQPSDLE